MIYLPAIWTMNKMWITPKNLADKNRDFPDTISLSIYLFVSISATAYTFNLQ
jgi:hypothetical protein